MKPKYVYEVKLQFLVHPYLNLGNTFQTSKYKEKVENVAWNHNVPKIKMRLLTFLAPMWVKVRKSHKQMFASFFFWDFQTFSSIRIYV